MPLPSLDYFFYTPVYLKKGHYRFFLGDPSSHGWASVEQAFMQELEKMYQNPDSDYFPHERYLNLKATWKTTNQNILTDSAELFSSLHYDSYLQTESYLTLEDWHKFQLDKVTTATDNFHHPDPRVNKGSSRHAYLYQGQIKGCGRNLLAVRADYAHSNGIFLLLHGIEEYIAGHIVDAILPLGAVKTKWISVSEAEGILSPFSRAQAVREGDFIRPLQVISEKPFKKVLEALQFITRGKPEIFFKKLLKQHAAMIVWGVQYGTYSIENSSMDGRILDHSSVDSVFDSGGRYIDIGMSAESDVGFKAPDNAGNFIQELINFDGQFNLCSFEAFETTLKRMRQIFSKYFPCSVLSNSSIWELIEKEIVHLVEILKGEIHPESLKIMRAFATPAVSEFYSPPEWNLRQLLKLVTDSGLEIEVVIVSQEVFRNRLKSFFYFRIPMKKNMEGFPRPTKMITLAKQLYIGLDTFLKNGNEWAFSSWINEEINKIQPHSPLRLDENGDWISNTLTVPECFKIMEDWKGNLSGEISQVSLKVLRDSEYFFPVDVPKSGDLVVSAAGKGPQGYIHFPIKSFLVQ